MNGNGKNYIECCLECCLKQLLGQLHRFLAEVIAAPT